MILAGVVRGRLRMARNLVWPRAGERGAKPRTLIGIALIVLLSAFVYASCTALFAELDALGLGLDRAGVALSVVFSAAAIGLLVFDLHHAVSGLLLDSDLELLRRAPLAPRALLWLKLFDSLPRTVTPAIVLALPAALAFAGSHRLPAWEWLLLPVQLAALWAVPLGLGTCGALLLVRVVSPRRAREALGLLSTLVLVLLWFANSFMLPRLMEEGGEVAGRLVAALTPPAWLVAISPPHWAGAAVAAAGAGRLAEALGLTLALAAIGTLALGAAAAGARDWLDEALARVANTPRPSRAAQRRTAPPPRGQAAAMLLKDARLFGRDWAVLGDVVTAALLWTLLPVVAGPVHRAPTTLVARAMMLALTVGLGYEVGARAVPFEREGLAWCRLAPVRAMRWNLVKLAGGAVISLPLVLIAALTIRFALPLGWLDWAEVLTTAVAALAVALCLGLWTGWKFGDPAWTNPRAMLTLNGRLIASFLLIVQAGIWFTLMVLADRFRETLPSGLALWGPPILAVLAGAPLLAAATRRAGRYEWRG